MPTSVTPSVFLATILDPGLLWCSGLPGWTIKSDDRARVLLLAIAGQEANWTARVQGGNGPAHSFWQMERGGGVKGVLTHPSTYKLATAACAAAGIPSDATHAWGLLATEKGDHLAVAFARLLLWSDPHALPVLGAEQSAWDYYVRNWRPGKPHPDAWPAHYQAAYAAVTGDTPI